MEIDSAELVNRIYSRELRLYRTNLHQDRWLYALSETRLMPSPGPYFVDDQLRYSTLGILMHEMGGVAIKRSGIPKMLWLDGKEYYNYLPHQIQDTCKIVNGSGYLNEPVYIEDEDITIMQIHDLVIKLKYGFHEVRRFIDTFPQLVFRDG